MTIHHATNGPPTVAIAPDGTIHLFGPVRLLSGQESVNYVEAQASREVR